MLIFMIFLMPSYSSHPVTRLITLTKVLAKLLKVFQYMKEFLIDRIKLAGT